MQAAPTYADVVGQVRSSRGTRPRLPGGRHRPGTDLGRPGIGFGKHPDHNLALLAALDRLADPDLPVLVGVSRKSLSYHHGPAAGGAAGGQRRFRGARRHGRCRDHPRARRAETVDAVKVASALSARRCGRQVNHGRSSSARTACVAGGQDPMTVEFALRLASARHRLARRRPGFGRQDTRLSATCSRPRSRRLRRGRSGREPDRAAAHAGIAYLTQKFDCSFGVVISASHNPYEDTASSSSTPPAASSPTRPRRASKPCSTVRCSRVNR